MNSYRFICPIPCLLHPSLLLFLVLMISFSFPKSNFKSNPLYFSHGYDLSQFPSIRFLYINLNSQKTLYRVLYCTSILLINLKCNITRIILCYCRVPVWGVLHCRCERTQTQQTQYNEFGREAGSRIGPLRGLRQRLSKIIREQDRQQRRGGVKVYPQALSEDKFLFSFSNTTQLRPSGVFRIAIPLHREISLVIYSSAPLILAVHLLIVQVAT